MLDDQLMLAVTCSSSDSAVQDSPLLVKHVNWELCNCTILSCGVKASGWRGASLFCWNWSHVLHRTVFFALSDRAIYGHSLVSLSVKRKLSWVMSSFGQKLGKWSLLFGELESTWKIQLAFSVLLLKLLLSISVFIGEDRIDVLSEIWDHYFTETLPTLQAIFYPVQVILITVQSGEAM